jgi:hypothetical protein
MRCGSVTAGGSPVGGKVRVFAGALNSVMTRSNPAGVYEFKMVAVALSTRKL